MLCKRVGVGACASVPDGMAVTVDADVDVNAMRLVPHVTVAVGGGEGVLQEHARPSLCCPRRRFVFLAPDPMVAAWQRLALVSSCARPFTSVDKRTM